MNHTPVRQAVPISTRLLGIPFFLSGLAALTYQVAWQRSLFIAFGVDIESVTMVVSIFMFGLGIGGLVGGALADRLPTRIPALFCGAEVLIALFGIVSIDLIAATGQWASGLSKPVVALLTFTLLLPPTLLMGATLPMLVAYTSRRAAGVGVAIGALYGVNTLGAAAGAFATGFVLLYWLDLREAAMLAAAANASAALFIGALLASRRYA